jgi:hypothetical protein
MVWPSAISDLAGMLAAAPMRPQGQSGHTVRHNAADMKKLHQNQYLAGILVGRIRTCRAAGGLAASVTQSADLVGCDSRAAIAAPELGAGEQFGQFRLVSGGQQNQTIQQAADRGAR